MFISWWRRVILRWRKGTGKKGRGARPCRSFSRFWVEPLEDRVVPDTYHWAGSINGTWTNPGNWTGGATYPHLVDDVAIFDIHTSHENVSIPNNANPGNTVIVGAILLTSTDAYTISASQSGNLEFQTSAGDATLTTGNAAGADVISAPITLGTQLDIDNNTNANSLTLSGIIQATGIGLVVGSGPSTGTIVLSGTNSYTGDTIIDGATLSIQADRNLGSATTPGQVVIDGGTLLATNNVTLTAGRSISVGPSADGGGTIGVASNKTLNYAGAIADTGAGGGELNLTGGGTLILSGSNTYSGTTNIQDGTLRLNGPNGQLPATTGLTLTAATNQTATLDLNGHAQALPSLSDTGAGTNQVINNSGTAGTLTLNPSGSDSFGGFLGNGNNNNNFRLIMGGTGTLTLGNSSNSYIGTTTINGGIVSITAGTDLGTAPNNPTPADIVINGGTLQAGGTFTLGTNRGIALGPLNTAGTGTIDVTPGNVLTYGGIIDDNGAGGTGSLIVADTGTLVLSGANTYSGSTTVQAGTLQLASGNNRLPAGTTLTLGDAANHSGTLDLNGRSQAVASIGTTGSGATNAVIDSAGGGTLTVNNGSGTDTYGGLLGNGATNNNFSLTKSGGGTLTLTNASNSYTGATTISSGATLSISADGDLGTAPAAATPGQLVINGGTLQATASFALNSNRGIALGPTSGSGTGTIDVTGSNTLTYGGIADDNGGGTGALAVTDTGTLAWSGVNTYSGPTTIGGGATLSISADSNLGTAPASTTAGKLVINGGALEAAASFTLNSKRGIALGPSSGSGTGTIDVTGGNTLSYGGIIANNGGGTGGLIDTDSGTLAFSGASTYGDGTTIQSGTLQLSGGNNRLPSGTALTLGDAGNDSGTLDLNGQSQAVASIGTTGSGATNAVIDSAGGGTLTVNNGSGTDTYGGLLGNGATNNNFSLTKSGGGTLTLTNASNSYTGATTISSGATLSISADGDLGTAPAAATPGQLVINGGTLQATASFALNSNRGIALGPTSGSGTGTIDVTGSNTLTYGGIIADNGAGTGALADTDTGTLALSGASTYSGPTTISGGATLSISADSNLGTAPATATPKQLVINGGTLQATATFTLASNRGIALGPGSGTGGGTIDVTNGNTLSYGGGVANNNTTDSLTETDAGTLALSGSSTYTGTTNVNGGVIALNGSGTSAIAVNNGGTLVGTGNTTKTVTVNAGGAINPGTVGTVGTLTVGGLTFNGGTYQADISGDNNDTIATGGAINLNGGTAGSFSLNSVSGTTDSGNVFTFINNTGGAISNPPFTGAAQNATVTVNGQTAGFSYVGGSGHNFTLSVSGPDNLNGTGTLKLQRVVSGQQDDIQFLQNGVVIDSRATSAVSSISVNGGANSTLTIDYTASGGYFSQDVTFTGSSNTNALVIKGNPQGGFGNITFTYTGAHSGTVKNYSDAAGTQLLNTISYSALAPLTDTGAAGVEVFNLPAAATVTAVLQDNGGSPQLVSTDATPTFESTTFAGPSGSLTVNAGGGTDSITTAASFTADFKAALAINGTAATDTVTLNNLTLGNGGANSGNVSVTANAIHVNGTIDTTAGSSGNVQLTAGGSIDETGAIKTNGTLTTSSATGTTLGGANHVAAFNASNSASGAISLTNTASTLTITGIGQTGTVAGSDISVTNTGAITTTTGGISTSTAGSGSIELSATGAETIGTHVTARGSGTATLSAGGLLSVNSNVSTSAGSISLSGVGVAEATGVTVNAGSGTITVNGGGGAINLNGGSVTTTNPGAAAVTVQHATTVALGNITANSGTLVVGAGDVSGAVTQNTSTAISASTLTANTSNSINLGNATNAIATLGLVTRGGALTLQDTGDLTVMGPVTAGTISNDVSIATTGALAVNGNVSTSGAHNVSLSGDGVTQATATSVNAGSGTITVNGGGGAINLNDATLTTTNATSAAVTVRNATTVALGNVTAASGTLTVGVGGDVSGAVSQTAGTTLSASTLVANTGNSITLDHATNAIPNLGTITSGGTLVINDASAPTVTGSINSNGNDVTICTSATGGIAINQAVNAGAGTLRLQSAGGVSQSAAITAATLGVSAAGAVTLTNGGNSVSTTFAATSTGAISFTDGSGFSTGQVTSSTCFPTTVNGVSTTANNASITLNAGSGGLTVAATNGAVSANGAGSVTLSAGGNGTISESGTGITVTGNAVSLTAGGGIGSASHPLAVIATTLTADSSAGNGNQFLSDSATVGLGAANALNAGNGTVTLIGGTFQILAGAGGNAIADATSVTVNSTVALDLNGHSETISALNGGGTVTSGAGGTATLTVNGGGSFSGVIQDGGAGDVIALAVGGSGQTLTLSGANTYSGKTTVSGGATLSIGADGELGTAPAAATPGQLVLNGGTLQATATFTLDSNRGIALGQTSGTGSGTIDVATGNTLSYAGVLANNGGGTGGLIVADSGTLVLSGASTYGGGTTIQAGTLQLSGGSNRLPNATALTLGDAANDSGTLDLNGQSQTLASISTTGTGATNAVIDSAGGGSLIVNNSGSDSYGGLLGNGATNNSFSLTKSNSGTLTLTNSGSSYTGVTTVSGGTLSISADGDLGTAPALPTPGQLLINGGTLQATASFTLNTNRGIALGPSSGSGTGTIDVTGGNTLTYGGIIADNGTSDALTKADSGTLTVNGVNTYTGTTNVNGGTLAVNGSTTSTTAVNNGGTLAGTGSATGSVTVNSGGTINPGTVGTVGTLTVGSLTFNGGSYQADISGDNSDTITTAGTINLGNGGSAGTFSLNSVSGTTSNGNVFTLINNVGAAVITTAFSNVAEGDSATVNGQTAFYSYVGGLGQSFTLSVGGGSPTVNGAGALTLESVLVGGNAILKLFQVVGGNTTTLLSRPVASVNGVTVNGAAGSTLTIDYTASGGYFAKDVTFTGSSNSNSLVVKGNPVGGFGRIAFTYTGAHSGTVQNYSDAGGTSLLNTITYSALAPLTDTSATQIAVFNLPAGTVGAMLQDDGSGSPQLVSTDAISTFEITTFADPSASLILNAGGGTDTISTAASFTADFNAALTINGTAATDTVTLNNLTLGNAGANSGNVSVTANAIHVNGTIDTTAGSSGNVQLTAGGSIGESGAISTNGTLTTSSATGTALGGANHVAAFNASNSASGAISLTNTAATLTITGIGQSGTVAGSDISVTNTGAITTTTGGISTSTAGSGSIQLSATGAETIGTHVTARGSGTATLSAGGLLSVNSNVSTSAGSISLSGAGVAEATGVTVNAGSGTITVNGGGAAVNLNGGSLTTTNATTAAVTIENATTVALGSITANSGTVVLGAGDITGAVTQNPGTAVSASALTANTSGSIALANGNNAISTLGSVTRGGALTLQDTGALTVTGPVTAGTISNAVSIATTGTLAVNGNVSTSGANNVSLSGGGVTQATGSTVNAGSGTITVNGGGGAVNLNGSSLTTTNATGAAVTVQNATTVALGNITASSGTVVLGAGDVSGAVTQNPGTAISANALAADTGGSITLGNSTNAVADLAAITTHGALVVNDASAPTVTGTVNSGGGDVTICTSAAGGIAVNQTINAGTGTLRLQSAGGVSQTAGVTAASLGVNAAATVTLTNSGNSLSTTFAATSTGAISFTDSVGFSTGQVSSSACFPTSVNGVSTTANNAAISLTASGGTLTVAGTNGNVTTNGSGSVTLQGAGLTQATGSTVNAGSGTITVNGGGGAVNLNGGSLTTTNATGAAVTIQNATTVALGNITASSGTVVLGAGDVSGAVTQNAATALSANTLTASTSGSVNLGNATNAIANLGAITTGGTLLVNDASAPTVTGAVNSNGSDVTIATSAAGGIAINQTVNAGTGTLRLQSAGGVSQSAAVSAANLGVSAAGTVTLTNAGNSVSTTFAATSTGPISFTDGTGFSTGQVGSSAGFPATVNGVSTTANNASISLTAASGSLTVSAGNGSVSANGTGSVALAAASSIGQTGSGTAVTGNALSVAASGGIGTAAQPLTVNGTTLTANSSGSNGNQFLADTATVGLGTANALNAGNGTVTLTGGTFKILAGAGGNAIAAATSVTINAPATLDLNGNSEGMSALNGGGTVTSGAAGTATLTVNGGGTFSGMIQDGGAGDVTALAVGGSGQTLTLSGANTYSGKTTVSGGATLSIGADGELGTAPAAATPGQLALNGGTLLATGGFTLNSNRGIALGSGGGTIDVTGANGLTYGGVIAGTGALNKVDSGTLALSGSSTYSGATIVSGGTLSISADNNLGTAPGAATAGQLVINGATLQATATFTLSSNRGIALGPTSGTGSGTIDVTGANTLTYGGVMANNGAGTGALVKTDTGTLILAGANTYSGGTTVSGGTLQVGNGGASGSIVGDVTDNGTLAFNLSGVVTYSGNVSGTGALTDAGSGTLTLGGTNTYGGTTTVSGGGTLTGSLPTNTALALVGTGSTFNMNGTSNQLSSLTGNGIVRNSVGAPTLTLNNSATDTFAGSLGVTGSAAFGLTVAGSGTLVLTGSSFFSGTATVNAGSTLQVGAGGTAGSIIANVTDNGSLVFNRSDVVFFPGVITGTGSVSQIGTGTLILTADSPGFAGTTTISPGGTLQLGNGGASGSIGGINNTGALVFNRSDTVTFSSDLGGSGSIVQKGPGTLILTGTNTYTGGTIISSGTLQIGNGGTTGSIVGNVTDNGRLVFNHSDAVTFAGTVTGTGGLTQAGSGTLTLAAANGYTGSTVVSAGTLALGIKNALLPTTALTVNGGAFLDLAGFNQSVNSLTLNPNSTYLLRLNDPLPAGPSHTNPVPGTDYSRLAVTGPLNVNQAVLQATFGTDTVPEDVFTIIAGSNQSLAGFQTIRLFNSSNTLLASGSGADSSVVATRDRISQYQIAYEGISELPVSASAPQFTNKFIVLTQLDVLTNGTGVNLQARVSGTGTGPFAVSAGPVASFTGAALGNLAQPAQNFLALVHWDDGTSSQATVTRQGTTNNYVVTTAGHVYVGVGTPSVTITIIPEGNKDQHQDATLFVAGAPAPRFPDLVLRDAIVLGTGLNSQVLAAGTIAQRFGAAAINQVTTAVSNIAKANLSLTQKQNLIIRFMINLFYTDPGSLAEQVREVLTQFKVISQNQLPSATDRVLYTNYLAQTGDREGLSVIVASSPEFSNGKTNSQFVNAVFADYYGSALMNSPLTNQAALTATINSYVSALARRAMNRTQVARAIITGSFPNSVVPSGDALQIEYLYNFLLQQNAPASALQTYLAQRRQHVTLQQIALEIATAAGLSALQAAKPAGFFDQGLISQYDPTEPSGLVFYAQLPGAVSASLNSNGLLAQHFFNFKFAR
jgi:autotransporter-associated beta strand protein